MKYNQEDVKEVQEYYNIPLASGYNFQDPMNGLPVKPENPRVLGKGIKRVYMDRELRIRLESNARNSIEMYDWEKPILVDSTFSKWLNDTK